MPNVLPLWSRCSSSQKALVVCTEVQSGPQRRARFQDARAIGNFHGAAPGELQHERAGRMGSRAEGRGSPDYAQSAMALPGDCKALPHREGCACPLVARGAWFNQSREKAPTRSVSRICISGCGAEELPAPCPLGCASNPCPGQQPGHGGCCLGGCHRGEQMGGPCGNGCSSKGPARPQPSLLPGQNDTTALHLGAVSWSGRGRGRQRTVPVTLREDFCDAKNLAPEFFLVKYLRQKTSFCFVKTKIRTWTELCYQLTQRQQTCGIPCRVFRKRNRNQSSFGAILSFQIDEQFPQTVCLWLKVFEPEQKHDMTAMWHTWGVTQKKRALARNCIGNVVARQHSTFKIPRFNVRQVKHETWVVWRTCSWAAGFRKPSGC